MRAGRRDLRAAAAVLAVVVATIAGCSRGDDVAFEQRVADVVAPHAVSLGRHGQAAERHAGRDTAAAAAELEALALRARGAHVRITGPDAEASAAMGTNFMDPGPATRVHQLGYRHGRDLA